MVFEKFIPKEYKKSILDINYEKLKEKGIKCLLLDLDNTLAVVDKKEFNVEIKKKLQEIKKDFKIFIVSNNFHFRIKPFCDKIDTNFISFSMKPLSKGFRKVQRKYGYKKSEICMIGDQLISDILGGNRFGIMTILVDPLSKKDLKITKINRILEKMILKKLEHKGQLERGSYYE